MKKLPSFLILFLCFFSANFSYSQNGIEENCQSARSEYLSINTDVKNAGLDPWSHYQNYGKKEGRKWPACTEAVNTTITAIYSGNLDANKTGQGEVRFSTGYSYKGWIQNGIANGKNCEITTPKGSRIIGDFSFDGKNLKGSGTIYGWDGSVSEGKFQGDVPDNLIQTDGFETSSDKKLVTYFKNGIYDGYKIIINNYSCEFRGPGSVIHADFYIGDFIASYKNTKFYFNVATKGSKAKLIKIIDKNNITYKSNFEFGNPPFTSKQWLDVFSQLPLDSWIRLSDNKVFYIDIESEEVSEMAPQIITKELYNTTVRSKETEVYKCKCCKKPINGFINAVDKLGSNFSYEPLWDVRMSVYFELHKSMQSLKNSEYYKSADLSPESVIQNEYPFCSQYCSKICKD